MSLEDIAASRRATLECELGQQRDSESEGAYIPLPVWLQDSKHVQKMMGTPGATLRAGCETGKLDIHPQSGHFSPTKKASSYCQSFQPCPLFPTGHAAHPPSKHQPAARCVNCPFQFLRGVPIPSSSNHLHHFWIHILESSTSSRASQLFSHQHPHSERRSSPLQNKSLLHTDTHQDSRQDGCPGTACCGTAAATLLPAHRFDRVLHSYQCTHCGLRCSVRGTHEESCIYLNFQRNPEML